MDAFHVGAAGDQPNNEQAFAEITAHLTDLDTTPIDPPAAPQNTRQEPAPPAPSPAPRPTPTPDYDRRRPPAPAPAPMPAAPTAVVAPLPRQPKRPKEPTAPDYWGRHGLVAVYWIAILTGAIGQVIFFGSLFNLGWGGYIAAGIIATTAETVMVAAGDTALHLRAEGRRKPQWVPFLLIAFVAATAASGMNLLHWWTQNVSMAVLFGGIAFLGFLLHVVHGIVQGTQYIADRADYDAELAEIEKQERAEAEQARREQQRQQREAEPPEQPTPPPSTPAPATRKPARKPGKKSSRASKADALRIGIEQRIHTPAALRSALTSAGYTLPASSTTVENWCRDIKAQLGEDTP